MSIGTTNRYARSLRRNTTDVENLLWQRLRNRNLGGLKFRRQSTVGPYVADFLCAELRLIVELDGGQHSEEVDAKRTADLESLDFHVIRFWNHEVNENLNGVLKRIIEVANALPSRFKAGQPSSNSG